MALEEGAVLRVRCDAEVRQAPSSSSPLLHVVQAGRLVKQMAAAVDVPGAGRRVPLVPRGWIAADVVEAAGSDAELRHPSTGMKIAAITSEAGLPAATAGDALGAVPAGGMDLLELLGDDRRPRRRCVPGLLPGGRAAADSQGTAEAEVRPTDHEGTRGSSGAAHPADKDGWWTSAGEWSPEWWASGNPSLALNIGGFCSGGSGGAAGAGWSPSEEVASSFRSFHTAMEAHGARAGGGGAAGGVLFSGTVARLPLSPGEALLECHEVRAVFGGHSELTVARGALPSGVELGAALCFALRGIGQGTQPEVIPGSLMVADCVAARMGWLAGTVKAFSKRQSGERLGWITSAATQRTYSTDVYLHGSMLEGLRIGDAVAFSVHENARGQPQASIGSVVRLGAGAASAGGLDAHGGDPAANVDGMDAAAYAPGRVIFGAVADEPPNDLLENLLDKARKNCVQQVEQNQ